MSDPGGFRRVWDLPVRVFHWTLLVAIAAAWATHAAGVAWFRYHVWCGYTVLALVIFRILWGFAGTRHARFRSFVRGPVATLRYLRAAWQRRSESSPSPNPPGHNPLGAWMVLWLLALLMMQALSGLFGNDEIFNTGPLSGYVTYETGVALTRFHRQLFDVILASVIVHILAVLGHWLVRRENLIVPLLTGRKSAAQIAESESIAGSRIGLALVLIAAIAAVLAWVVGQAPTSKF